MRDRLQGLPRHRPDAVGERSARRRCGLAGVERLDRHLRHAAQGEGRQVDRLQSRHTGCANVEGEGAWLDRQAGAYGRHPGSGEWRPLQLPDDLGDPVQFRGFGLSCHAGGRLRQARGAGPAGARRSGGADEGEGPAERSRAIIGILRLAQGPLSRRRQCRSSLRRHVELRGPAEGNQRRAAASKPGAALRRVPRRRDQLRRRAAGLCGAWPGQEAARVLRRPPGPSPVARCAGSDRRRRPADGDRHGQACAR